MMFVDFMFYTHLPAFEGIPTGTQSEYEVHAKGKEVYVLVRGEPIDSAIAAQVHLIAAPDLQWK
ncbi:MAG: hypothetical protein U5L96_15800 [Owenweeksia sp.]|nr:hypothetical protein [Owenweeksia sp.]